MQVTLCQSCNSQVDDGDLVGAWRHWHVVVNYSQNYLGKVMLVLRRHETDVTELTDLEQAELWSLLGLVKDSLVKQFAPDHFNYAFLMNEDRHVHLHVIPRYKDPREFAGQVFADGRLGEHYQLGRNLVPIEVRRELAARLREQGLVPPADP